MKLVFGIYPGGASGGETGLLLGPPDDPARVTACMNQLQGKARPFVVRCYDSFQDSDSPLAGAPCAPAGFPQYAVAGSRPLDLVLQFRSASGDVAAYLDFLRARLDQHHASLYSVQITEEANFSDGPQVIDGPYPNVLRALTEGVAAARERLNLLGHPGVKVGFNATPTFGPPAEFWTRLRELGGETFAASLDYAGLDFFPDVFRAVAGDKLAAAVTGVLETMRRVWLPAAGIPERVPIHITEHGWPTGATRSAERQAEVIDTAVRTVHAQSDRLNIERYTLFDLRDVCASGPDCADDIFRFFGITTTDYAPKKAFDVYRRLIEELG